MRLPEKDFIKKYLTNTPPEGCDFRVGETVTYTNDYGIEFRGQKIIGFCDGLVYLSDNAYWFGNPVSSIKKEKAKKND